MQSTIDNKQLENDFFNQDERIWEPIAERYILTLTSDQIIEAFYKKFKSLPPKVVIYLPFPPRARAAFLTREGKKVRELIPYDYRLELFRDFENFEGFEDEILQCMPKVDKLDWEKFCREMVGKIRYRSEIFRHSPEDVQRIIIITYYKDLLADLRSCFLLPQTPIRSSPKKLYSDLQDEDRELIKFWENIDGQKSKEFHEAKMLSARAAEKAVMKIYQSLGFQVEDVSLHQLNKKTNDWDTHDLCLDGSFEIDVKNARTPLNNDNRYVEQYVKWFKISRAGQAVVIAGVLSPYLKLDKINSPSEISDKTPDIRFLGETMLSRIRKLERQFSSKSFKLNISINNTIPPWIYDYSKKMYEAQELIRANLGNILASEIPTKEECNLIDINLLPVFLISGQSLPNDWQDGLFDWEIDFYRRLQAHPQGRINLPHLFLTLLTHFLCMVSNPDSNYWPSRYTKLLILENEDTTQRLLGIIDPLNIIDDFIKTLGILWTNREILQLGEYKYFKFGGLGLLEGKRQESDKLETILAYCGGFIQKTGKCGYSPLIKGQHENCPKCGKLICEKCGYCNEKCEECVPRMMEKQTAEENYNIPPEFGEDEELLLDQELFAPEFPEELIPTFD